MNKRGSVLLSLLAGILILGVVLFFMLRDENDSKDIEDNQDIEEQIQDGNLESAIDSGLKNAAISSIYTYISTIELELAKELLDGNDFVNGKYSVSQIENMFTIVVRFDKPSDGNFCITDGVITGGNLKLNNYIISYDGKNAEVTDSTNIGDVVCP